MPPRTYHLLSHGLLLKFAVLDITSLLWSKTHPVRKQLVTPITVRPLLHQWAHLARQVGIVSCKVQN